VGDDLAATADTFTDAEPPVGGTPSRTSCSPQGGRGRGSCEALPSTRYFAEPRPHRGRPDAGKAKVVWSPAVKPRRQRVRHPPRRQGDRLGRRGGQRVRRRSAAGPGFIKYRIVPRSLGRRCPARTSRIGDLAAPSTVLFGRLRGLRRCRRARPGGWEIHEEGTPIEDCAWTIANPGSRGNPPLPDGSPSWGSSSSPTRTSPRATTIRIHDVHDIWSPPFSTIGMDVVWLHMGCSAVLNNNGEVVFDVDVTVDGARPGRTSSAGWPRAAPWTPCPGGHPRLDGGRAQTGNADNFFGSLDIDLSAVAADQDSVRFRLRQFEPSDDWWNRRRRCAGRRGPGRADRWRSCPRRDSTTGSRRLDVETFSDGARLG